MIPEKIHFLISACEAAEVEINDLAKLIASMGYEEKILYLSYYVAIEKDGIYPNPEVWKEVPNWRKNEILTTAYDYQRKGLYDSSSEI